MLVINNDACISIANIKCSSLTKRNKKNKKNKKKKKKDGGQHMWYTDKNKNIINDRKSNQIK